MKVPKQDSDVSAKVDCFWHCERVSALSPPSFYYTIFPDFLQEKWTTVRFVFQREPFIS